MRCEVLIIGSGPTGAMLALELARRGVDCCVVEREGANRPQAGGLVVNPHSLWLLKQADVLEDARADSLRLLGTTWFSGQTQRYLPLDFSQTNLPIPEVWVLPQDRLSKILRQRASDLGCAIVTGLSFEGFTENGPGQDLTVTLVSAFGAETKAQCRYLVGCDGARSTVRQAAGIEFPGQILDWVYSVAEVYVDWPLAPTQSFEFLGKSHVLTALPLPAEGRYRFSTWEHLPADDRVGRLGQLESAPTLDTFQDVASRIVPFTTRLSEPSFMGRYRVARKMAERFRSGRVFLAGDAAHLFPPVTGLGMNLGLQDGAALAEVLSQAVSYELLESYHRERSTAARHALEVAEHSILELATSVLHGTRGEAIERTLNAERWGVSPDPIAPPPAL